MYLAIILYCTSFTDSSSCDVMVRKNQLHETKILCEAEMKSVAKGLLDTGHYVKAKCFDRSSKEFYAEEKPNNDHQI